MRLIAIDTETVRDEPWSVQWCSEPGIARMALVAPDSAPLSKLQSELESPDVLTVVHNAIFDVGIMRQVGIRPHKVADTMVMAYLLGESRIGLKILSYRKCNMNLVSYSEMVREAAEKKARRYVAKVIARTWPDPDPVLVIKPDGTQHIKFSQNISSRLKRYLKKYDEGKAAKTMVEYWNDKKMAADRAMIEPVLGVLEPGYLSDIKRKDAVAYACMDADATLRLYDVLWPQIIEENLEEVFWRDMEMLPMLMQMMENGMLIDKEHFYKLEEEFDVKSEELLEQIEELHGGYLNPGSSKQCLEALQSRGLNIKSTNAKELAAHRGDELVRLIQDYRGYRKLNSTYVSVLPGFADGGGRVHTTLSTTRTSTGRLASSNPNLQNQPARSEDGRRIRGGFIASEGCHLVAIDYSQIELRMAAHMSQDPVMMDIYRHNGDIHMQTACSMFQLKPEQVENAKHRKPAKTVNFGTIYGMFPPTLLAKFYQEDIFDFDESDCALFIQSWKDLYCGYFGWTDEVKAFARRNGYVVDMFGRRRHIPEVYSSHKWIQESGLREAVNAPVQSGAGGVLKKAIVDLIPVNDAWQSAGYIVRPLMQVHDELIWEIEDDIMDAVIPEFVTIMEQAVELSVPVIADVKVGLNWQDMKSWKGASE